MTEYYITRVDKNQFKVVKFTGDAQPENVYFVIIRRKGEDGFDKNNTDPQMHCDCPNRRRAAHVNDKHGKMVAKWILAGERAGYFDEKGEFHKLPEYKDETQHTDTDGDRDE